MQRSYAPAGVPGPPMGENARVGQETPLVHPSSKISHGRVIRVVSVFPKQGTETPEDKLKALTELEFQQGKLCA